MMRDGFLPPTRNLDEVDPEVRRARLRAGERPRRAARDVVMTNNFAFGGINTSLILRRV